MDIGFLTNTLAGSVKDLGAMAAWAADNGFAFLEIGPTIPLEEKLFEEVRAKTGIRYEGFIYCRNILSENPKEAADFRAGLLERAKFGAKIGAKKIICSSGVTAKSFSAASPADYQPENSFPEIKEALAPVIEVCEKNGVKLCFEICPMMGTVAQWMGKDYMPMQMAYASLMGQITPSGAGPASAISILMALVAGVLAVIYAISQRRLNND